MFVFFKFLGCHAKLFLEKFNEIRRGIYPNQITDFPYPVSAFLNQHSCFLEAYQSDKIGWRKTGKCLNFTMQARTASLEVKQSL